MRTRFLQQVRRQHAQPHRRGRLLRQFARIECSDHCFCRSGDQEVGAIAAAIADEQRFQISLPGGTELFGFLGEKPVIYRGSLQIPGRKRPVRHLTAVSQTLFGTTLGADGQARRTVLYDGSSEFVLHRLAVRFGLPALPEWAEWFGTDLQRRGLVEELLGFNCSPVAIQGTKLRMLRILSTGIKRKLISVPREVFVSTLPPEAG